MITSITYNERVIVHSGTWSDPPTDEDRHGKEIDRPVSTVISTVPQVDITGPTEVEVQFSEDGKRVWVNVDGICALRICRIPTLLVEDNRSPMDRSLDSK